MEFSANIFLQTIFLFRGFVSLSKRSSLTPAAPENGDVYLNIICFHNTLRSTFHTLSIGIFFGFFKHWINELAKLDSIFALMIFCNRERVRVSISIVIQGQKSRKWNFNGQHVFDYERLSKEAKNFFSGNKWTRTTFRQNVRKKVRNDAESSWISCSKLLAP